MLQLLHGVEDLSAKEPCQQMDSLEVSTIAGGVGTSDPPSLMTSTDKSGKKLPEDH